MGRKISSLPPMSSEYLLGTDNFIIARGTLNNYKVSLNDLTNYVSNHIIPNIQATAPITVSGTTTKTVGLLYSTTNLRLTANALDTVQDISPSSSPTFSSINLTSLVQGTSNSVVTYENNTLKYRYIDSRVWGSSLVDCSGTFTDYIPRMSSTNTITSSIMKQVSTSTVEIKSSGSTAFLKLMNSIEDNCGGGIAGIYASSKPHVALGVYSNSDTFITSIISEYDPSRDSFTTHISGRLVIYTLSSGYVPYHTSTGLSDSPVYIDTGNQVKINGLLKALYNLEVKAVSTSQPVVSFTDSSGTYRGGIWINSYGGIEFSQYAGSDYKCISIYNNKVGIKKQIPDYDLDVSGNMYVSGTTTSNSIKCLSLSNGYIPYYNNTSGLSDTNLYYYSPYGLLNIGSTSIGNVYRLNIQSPSTISTSITVTRSLLSTTADTSGGDIYLYNFSPYTTVAKSGNNNLTIYNIYAYDDYSSCDTYYGLYVNCIWTTATTKYSIYATGGNVYINGNVGIGTSPVTYKLAVNGTFKHYKAFYDSVTYITSGLTLSEDHSIVIINAQNNNVVCYLPDANNHSGIRYLLKRIDSTSNSVTISAYGTQTIDGQYSINLTGQYSFVEIVASGGNWYIIGHS